MDEIQLSTITDYFVDVDDPRMDRTKRHMFIDIITIALCAVICGADGWVDVEHYGREKYAWLHTFLQLPNGIPSHDTFGRVFARIDPHQFQACFIRWVQSICLLEDGEIIPIDGKTVRHSFDTGIGQSPIRMVSAWAATQRLVLGQRKVDEHSNEITAIPELIQTLDIANCTITIDAVGCQKSIVSLIREKNADYVIAVKANQGVLFEEIQAIFAYTNKEIGCTTFDTHMTYDNNHGRHECRRYWTTSTLQNLSHKDDWKDIHTVGMVESERTVNEITSVERRYYILSGPSDAKAFGSAVRAHWGIENAVHWILDIAFREDDSRIRMDHGPENFAVLRHIALNLLKQEQTFKGSIKSKRLKAGWNNDYLIKILRSTSL